MVNEQELFYYASINEDGWKEGQKELGYKPEFDKKYITIKVRGILTDMFDAKLIYVSNGSQGDCITADVVCECKKRKRYDQYSIIEFIIRDSNVNGHWKYWKKRSKEVLKE